MSLFQLGVFAVMFFSRYGRISMQFFDTHVFHICELVIDLQ